MTSYEIAKPKLKLAEEQSDLNTDDEEAKNQRKFRKKKVISSSEDEVYEEDHIHSQLKPFPLEPQTKNVHKKKSFNNGNDSQPNDELNENDNLSESDITIVPLKVFTSSARSSPISTSSSNIQGTTTSHSIQSFLSDEDFKSKICRDLSFIKINLIKLNQRIALLEAGPKQKINEDDDEQSRDYNIIIKSKFPLQTYEDLAEVEAKLQAEPEFKSKLIRYCSSIGGHKIDQITKLILRKLFTDQLASLYSWLGAKRKRVFSNLILAEVILSSVHAHCVAANATEKEIIDSIKNWLRHANTRDKNKRYLFAYNNKTVHICHSILNQLTFELKIV